jgi:hypothetical protein
MLMNYNKIFFLLFILSSVNNYLKGTETQTVSVVIAPSSHVIINGNTNVFSFNCQYSNGFTEPVDIKFRKYTNKIEIDNARLKIPVECINCHNTLMNNDLRELLNAGKTPYIVIDIYDFYEKNIVPDELNSSVFGFGTANVNIEIAGITNEYDIEFIDRRKDNEIIITSAVNLKLKSFGLEPPKKMLGLIRLYDNIKIEILLRLFINDYDN